MGFPSLPDSATMSPGLMSPHNLLQPPEPLPEGEQSRMWICFIDVGAVRMVFSFLFVFLSVLIQSISAIFLYQTLDLFSHKGNYLDQNQAGNADHVEVLSDWVC